MPYSDRNRDKVVDDIDEEFNVHVDMETKANIERGMSPSDALSAALQWHA